VPETTATFGTAGRNIARGPGYFNIDLNLIKVSSVGERIPSSTFTARALIFRVFVIN